MKYESPALEKLIYEMTKTAKAYYREKPGNTREEILKYVSDLQGIRKRVREDKTIPKTDRMAEVIQILTSEIKNVKKIHKLPGMVLW